MKWGACGGVHGLVGQKAYFPILVKIASVCIKGTFTHL